MQRQKLDSLSFEDTYARLEEIIERLESDELSLEESVSLYEEGMKLAEHCDRQLDDAELKVTRLLSAVAEELDRDEPDDY